MLPTTIKHPRCTGAGTRRQPFYPRRAVAAVDSGERKPRFHDARMGLFHSPTGSPPAPATDSSTVHWYINILRYLCQYVPTSLVIPCHIVWFYCSTLLLIHATDGSCIDVLDADASVSTACHTDGSSVHVVHSNGYVTSASVVHAIPADGSGHVDVVHADPSTDDRCSRTILCMLLYFCGYIIYLY